MKRIILDLPLMKYYSIASKADHVTFLCGENLGAHLIKNLRELNIPYSFINIPSKDLRKYINNDNYKGD